MRITGTMFIGKSEVRGTLGSMRAFNPATGTELDPEFGAGGEADVDCACLLAQRAFDSYRETSLSTRARFLKIIAQGILGLGDVLIDRASRKPGFPRAELKANAAACRMKGLVPWCTSNEAPPTLGPRH